MAEVTWHYVYQTIPVVRTVRQVGRRSHAFKINGKGAQRSLCGRRVSSAADLSTHDSSTLGRCDRCWTLADRAAPSESGDAP